jgi:PAS domain S-box-containing protein
MSDTPNHNQPSPHTPLLFERFMSQQISGLATVRPNGSILGVDASAARILGVDAQSVKGKNIRDFIPVLEIPEVFSVQEQHGLTTIKHEKQARTVAYTLRGGWEKEQGLYFLVLHLRDSLTKGLELYRHMFEWIPTGLVVYHLDEQRPLTCNQRLLDLIQVDQEPEALRPDSPLSQKLKIRLSGTRLEEEQSFQVHLKTPDGHPVCLKATTSLIPALDESIILVLLQDITQQNVNARALKESRNTLEAIIGNAVDGIIIIDHRGRIQMTNEATSLLFGYSPEEMLGQNINMLMPEPHRSAHDGYLRNYMATGEGQIIGVGREVQGQRKNGELFPFRLGVSRIETEVGLLFTGVIHDLTEEHKAKEEIISLNRELEQKVEERTEKLTEVVNKLLQSNLKLEEQIKERRAAEEALKKNEEELRQALEREKELSELKSRFVSMASHEFRTPLTTIASSSELIKLYTEGTQQPKREKHLRRIQSAVTNLTGILGDFLSLSKLEEGKISNVPAPVSLPELLEESVDDVHVLLKKEQSVVRDFEGMEQEVMIDRKILKNIMLNLLSNAIKYSDAGSTVWLTARLEQGTLKVKVRDEGIGIPESDQKHLFSRFFRADNAVNIQGTGLGLNIVHRYLELLGGSIRFESVEGKGTTFFFEVPVGG